MYHQEGDRVVRDVDGFVAVRRKKLSPKIISLGSDEYRFDIRANICMCWLPPQYVDKVLSITETCCGGNKTHPYSLEIFDHVRRWEVGGGR